MYVGKRRKVYNIYFFIIYLIFCLHGEEKIKKGRDMRYSSYYTSSVSYKRNLCLEEKVICKGKLKEIIVFSKALTMSNMYNDFFFIDDKYGCVSTESNIYIVSLNEGKIIYEDWRKTLECAPAVIGKNKEIFFTPIDLTCLKIEDSSVKAGSEWTVYDFPTRRGALPYLYIFDEFFVGGRWLGPDQHDRDRTQLILGARRYERGHKAVWYYEFDNRLPFPAPLLTDENNFILWYDGKFIVIESKSGKKIKEVETEKEVIENCIGWNNNIYTVAKSRDGSKYYLVEYDSKEFKEIWRVEIVPIDESYLPFPPPIVLSDGSVFLVYKNFAVGYRGMERVCSILRRSDEKNINLNFMGIGTGNNYLIFVDGNEVFCVDSKGKELWRYKKDDEDTFYALPNVHPKDGSVWVFDRKGIYILR